MKKNNIIYWIFTILFSAFMIYSSFNQIRNTPDAHAFMAHLGYPDYFSQFIGVMKVLGIIAILVPGFARLKEWAYAGLFFDLAGAAYSFIAVDGFNPGGLIFMLVVIIFLFVSYIYFHKRLNNSGSPAM
ncbi:MAG TPA: DoxX family protein [Puia sp.]|nr:DoxX family protein [Puia sp.]